MCAETTRATEYKFHWKRLLAFILVCGAIATPLLLARDANDQYWRDQPLEKGPYLSWEGNTSTSMTVSWETVRACDSVVDYGTTRALDQRVYVAENVTLHSVHLPGLLPDTQYFYRVATTTPGANSTTFANISTFKTGPAAFRAFKFAVTGDTQVSAITQSSRTDWVAARIHTDELDPVTLDLSFVIATGDQFHYGDHRPDDIQRYFTQTRALGATVPVMTARGNHDRMGGGSGYRQYMALPADSPNPELDYEYIYAGCYFLVLDVSTYKPGYISPERLAWVASRLQAAQAYPYRFVAFHCPFYASQFPISYYADKLGPLFTNHSVTAVFTGHLHYYEHITQGGVHYFVNGGGGGVLNGVHVTQPYSEPTLSRQYHYLRVEVETTRVRVTVISVQGAILDQISIPAGGV